MAIREAESLGSLSEVKEAGLDREDLLGVYRNMVITRGIEERGHILYKQGKIPGSFYTGRGNEASAVGVATAMGPHDVGTPLHRDMGVHVTRGVEPWRIFAQYMGRSDGPTHGRDGNVHMADSNLGLIAMVSHLPAMLPVAVGCALAFRIRDESRVAVGWYGEGASARGEARRREGAGRRRADAARVPDAANGGPRRSRRRLLRPQGNVRGVGQERPDRALPNVAVRASRADRRRGGRDLCGRQKVAEEC